MPKAVWRLKLALEAWAPLTDKKAECMTISNSVKEEDQAFRDMVAKRLKRARHAAGFTMAAVADRLGYTNLTMISLFENGRRAPSLKITLRLADLYCVTTDYLLGRTDDIGLAPEEGNQALITGVLKTVMTHYHEKYVAGLAAVTAIAVEGASMDRVLLGRVADISVELSNSLAVVRRHHRSDFEEMRGGGKLERLIHELSSSVEARILSKKREKALMEYEHPICTAQQITEAVQKSLFY